MGSGTQFTFFSCHSSVEDRLVGSTPFPDYVFRGKRRRSPQEFGVACKCVHEQNRHVHCVVTKPIAFMQEPFTFGTLVWQYGELQKTKAGFLMCLPFDVWGTWHGYSSTY